MVDVRLTGQTRQPTNRPFIEVIFRDDHPVRREVESDRLLDRCRVSMPVARGRRIFDRQDREIAWENPWVGGGYNSGRTGFALVSNSGGFMRPELRLSDDQARFRKRKRRLVFRSVDSRDSRVQRPSWRAQQRRFLHLRLRPCDHRAVPRPEAICNARQTAARTRNARAGLSPQAIDCLMLKPVKLTLEFMGAQRGCD